MAPPAPHGLPRASLVLIAVLVAACGPGVIQTLSFGTGGVGCDLTGIAATFSATDDIHLAATFSPVPEHVDVTFTKDGVADPHVASIDMGGDRNCVTVLVGRLDPGHYEVVLTPTPSEPIPSLTGAFDVSG
jgi:hypothetical protein